MVADDESLVFILMMSKKPIEHGSRLIIRATVEKVSCENDELTVLVLIPSGVSERGEATLNVPYDAYGVEGIEIMFLDQGHGHHLRTGDLFLMLLNPVFVAVSVLVLNYIMGNRANTTGIITLHDFIERKVLLHIDILHRISIYLSLMEESSDSPSASRNRINDDGFTLIHTRSADVLCDAKSLCGSPSREIIPMDDAS